ncbi:xanthine phosphoribosyltransferase [Peptoniphilus raoultii]|uniref:xanthine phosphoribosyltransferase n=1 Tax=Peptoniphilus raoultii TaxID=1776387 RepID=UPI0008D9435C|nr:xanthine phosphoribosyltransferase [Peptoniphilus raoultii]
MKLLEDKIKKDGKILAGDIIKVDSFLNHQLDINFLNKLAEDIASHFKEKKITKILTIEASGIALATVLSAHIAYIPVVFCKKQKTLNIGDNIWQSHVKSFTTKKEYKITVSKEFLNENDEIIIIDDFLSEGNALKGMIELANMAGAKIKGVSVAIEKSYLGGGDLIRSMGYNLYSQAIIKSIDKGTFEFK